SRALSLRTYALDVFGANTTSRGMTAGPPRSSRTETSRFSGWLISISVRLFEDSTNANVRGAGSSAPGTTIGGDSITPSGTEPNERIVLSVGFTSLGGSCRWMTASSFGLRKKPASSGPAAEKYATTMLLSGATATRSNGEPISYAMVSASGFTVSITHSSGA